MADESPKASSESAPLRLRILLALFAITATLLVLEFGARYFITNVATREQFSKYAALDDFRDRVGADEWWFGLLVPHRYLGYGAAPNLVDGENRHNAQGMRGADIAIPKPEGTFRIACLGASTTYSILIPDYERSYPSLLEAGLRERGFTNVDVVNAGVPAWSSYETMINYLLRVQDLEPDLLIVHQAFGDVATRMVWPPEVYKGDNSGYYSSRYSSRESSWYEWSALLRILMVEAGQGLPASAFGKSIYNEAPTSYYLDFVRQRIFGKFPSGIFEEATPAQMFAANPPTFFRRNTKNLIAAAQNAGTKVLLMTFAYSKERTGFFGVEGFGESTDQHNRILGELAAESGASLFDLSAALTDDATYWAPDGIHVNEAGVELKARLVTDFLVGSGLLEH